MFFYNGTSGELGRIYGVDPGILAFAAGSSGIERMRLDAGGNVAIGNTATSLAKFQVYNPTLLGTSAGSQLNYQTLFSPDGNVDYLEFTNTRQIAGSSWVGAGSRIQQKVDTTWMGYIQFNGGGSSVDNQGGISFGTGQTTTSATTIAEKMRIDIGGNVAIGTTTTSSAKLTVATSDTNLAALFSGASKGVRIVPQSTGTLIEGVDNTGLASYQPLTITGSVIGFTYNNTTKMTVDASGLTMSSNLIAANLSMAAYTEKMTSLAITTNGTTDLNLQTSSVFKVSIGAFTANLRFINPPASGTAVSATLIIQYTGTPTITLQGNTSAGAAGTMKYAYNTAPTLTANTGKSDILSVITYDGGATYIVAPSFMNFTT
jgi:hypothetical protein